MNTEFSEFTNPITLHSFDLVSVLCHLVQENSVFIHLVNMLGQRHYPRTHMYPPPHMTQVCMLRHYPRTPKIFANLNNKEEIRR
jgi:hypothetical protein